LRRIPAPGADAVLHPLDGDRGIRSRTLPGRGGRIDRDARPGRLRFEDRRRRRHGRAPLGPGAVLLRRAAPLPRARGGMSPGGRPAAGGERGHRAGLQRAREGSLAMMLVLTLLCLGQEPPEPAPRPRMVRSEVRVLIVEAPEGDYEHKYYEQPWPVEHRSA